MAIQNRRGAYGDFDPSKMVPGEFAVVQSNDPNATDGKSVYLAFAAGDVKRLATHDDMVAEITDITEDIIDEVSAGIEEAIHDDVETASAAAETATQKAADASDSAEEAAQTVATIIDNTLSQSGKAADAQKTGLITAPQYSTSATYNVGDYVIYSGSLYRCTTKISTAEPWTSGHWTAAKVGSELSDLKSALKLCTDWSEQSNDWVKGSTSGHRYYIYLGQSNDIYKVTIANGIWFAYQGFTSSDYSGSYSYTSDLYTGEAEFKLDSETTGYYYRLALGQNTAADIPSEDRANSKVFIMKNVLSDPVADLEEAIDDLSDKTTETFAKIADIKTESALAEEILTVTGVGNKRTTITGLQAGDRVRVQMTLNSNVSYTWDILTSATNGGATIRNISGSSGDENGNVTGSNDVVVVLQGAETCIAVRGINYASGTKTFSVVITKLPTVPTHIKSSALVNTYKRIVWFGTSIPEGNLGTLSYPLVLGQKLGVTVYNEAVGSSRARASWIEFVSQNNPIGAGSGYNSLKKAMGYTLSEKQYLIDNYATLKDQFTDTHPETLSDAEILAIKNYSFERKLYRYLDAKKTTYETVDSNGFIGDVDVYVLDHGYNDVTTLYQSDKTIPEPGSTNEMYYYAGAMNRYIKEIMENNLHAQIVIITHYANTEGQKDAVAVEMQNKIAERWGIPIVRVYEKTGWTNMTLTINGTTKTVRQAWLPDGVHPASDTTGKAIGRYVDILYPVFRDLLANA